MINIVKGMALKVFILVFNSWEQKNSKEGNKRKTGVEMRRREVEGRRETERKYRNNSVPLCTQVHYCLNTSMFHSVTPDQFIMTQ